MGHLAGATGAATGGGLDTRGEFHLDPARCGHGARRDGDVQGAGPHPRAHTTVDGTVADGLLDLGQPHEDRLRRAMIGREESRRPAMHAIAVTKSRVLLVLAIVAAGLMLGGSTASAATVSIDLCAVPGNATLTGAVAVPIWGFGVPTTPGDCTTATASLPGPQLAVTLSATETTAVTFNVTNALPAGHSITFEIPGIAFAAGPTDAAPGATVTRSFTAPVSPSAPGAANAAGTYLYGSGGDGGRQAPRALHARTVMCASRPPGRYPPGVQWCRPPDGLRHVYLPGDLLADQWQGIPGHSGHHGDGWP